MHTGLFLLLIFSANFLSDDYRDLWPTQEQPATYLKNIMTWQPPVSIQHAPLPSVSPPSFSELDDDDGQCDDFFYRI
jgi:hypothetical protein